MLRYVHHLDPQISLDNVDLPCLLLWVAYVSVRSCASHMESIKMCAERWEIHLDSKWLLGLQGTCTTERQQRIPRHKLSILHDVVVAPPQPVTIVKARKNCPAALHLTVSVHGIGQGRDLIPASALNRCAHVHEDVSKN